MIRSNCRLTSRKSRNSRQFPLTLMTRQSEKGRVIAMRSMDSAVRRNAASPGPSGSAGKGGRENVHFRGNLVVLGKNFTK